MNGFIFGFDLSLQMAMIGILDFLMRAFSAPTPPRSPADIPSTSSMIITDLRLIDGSALPSCHAASQRRFVASREVRERTPSEVLKKPERLVLSTLVLKAFLKEYKLSKYIADECVQRTSINFLLRVSEAFSSRIS